MRDKARSGKGQEAPKLFPEHPPKAEPLPQGGSAEGSGEPALSNGSVPSQRDLPRPALLPMSWANTYLPQPLYPPSIATPARPGSASAGFNQGGRRTAELD